MVGGQAGVTVLILVAALAGCTTRPDALDDVALWNHHLPAVRAMVPQGPPFNDELRVGYLRLADAMKGAGDVRDYLHFARKAVAAAQGLPALPGPQVGPDALELREVPDEEVEPLAAARERLLAVLAANPVQPPPREAASAQVAFDCWLEAAESGRRPLLLQSCRNRVATDLARLRDIAPAG